MRSARRSVTRRQGPKDGQRADDCRWDGHIEVQTTRLQAEPSAAGPAGLQESKPLAHGGPGRKHVVVALRQRDEGPR